MKKPTIIFDLSGTLVKMRPPILLANRKLLQRLAKTFNLVIVTGAQKNETQNILEKLKIQSYFSVVIASTNNRYKKPNPKYVNQLINPSEIFTYFGDTTKDYLLATALKVPFLYVGKKSLGTYQNQDPNKLIKYLFKEMLK